MKKTVSTAGREDPVVVGELHLGLEVADRAQAANDRAGATGLAEVDGQAIEGDDVEPVGSDAVGRERGLDDRDPRIDREQRRLARVGEDAHDHAIEDRQRAADDVEMSVRDRVERAGVDRGRHRTSWRR